MGSRFWGPHVHAICSQNTPSSREHLEMGPGRTVRHAAPQRAAQTKRLPGAWLADGAALRAAPAGSSLGSEPIFFAFCSPFLPVLEGGLRCLGFSSQAHLFSGRSLMGTCGHSNCLFILVQGSGSLSHPVSEPSAASGEGTRSRWTLGCRNLGVRLQQGAARLEHKRACVMSAGCPTLLARNTLWKPFSIPKISRLCWFSSSVRLRFRVPVAGATWQGTDSELTPLGGLQSPTTSGQRREVSQMSF